MTKENEFELHPQLAADCVVIGDLPLNRVLLMNDANYPWVILVPRRPALRELYELDEADSRQFFRESGTVGRAMMTMFDGHKFNVAALGNMVPQLHVHHIVRFPDDAAWPGPIWGVVPTRPYIPDVLAERVAQLQSLLTTG